MDIALYARVIHRFRKIVLLGVLASIVLAFLTLFAVYYLLPLWVVIANAFRDLPEISRNGLIGFPQTFNATAWKAAWSTAEPAA